MTLHRNFDTIEDANAAAWELMEAGFGNGRTRVVRGDRPAVEVDPAFGTALAVIGILEKRRPGDEAPAVVTEHVSALGDGWWSADGEAAGGDGADDAAPLSRALNWPVLTRNNWFFSSLFNWNLLSNDPAPLSRLLGLRVLLHGKKRVSRRETAVGA